MLVNEVISVLVVEDSFYSADLNIRELKKAGFEVRYQIVSDGESLEKALKEYRRDLIISDNSMPGFSALSALKIRNRVDQDIPFIIVSEDIFKEDIDKAFEEGCAAYIPKENLTELRSIAADVMGGKRIGIR